MAAIDGPGKITGARQALRWMFSLLALERSYFTVAVIYGIGVSILSLATPISVQTLINSVANTALVTPLITLAMVLLLLLLIAVLLSSLRIYIMELFGRRFYARLVAEITLRSIQARNPFFEDTKRLDLFNRYFDVVTVQKAVPGLLIGGFTIILQSVVGFMVTAFYHPFFLAFNLSVIAFAMLIMLLWTRGAIRSGLALSHAKYECARWLENVGASNGFYKSLRHVDFAIERSEEQTANYINAKKRHFRYTFSQTVAFLLLYAISSAGLLALGGWLVIQGELSIGQLVAAELILSAAFFGIGQIGAYLDTVYELVAAAEEIGLIFNIEQEGEMVANDRPIPGSDLVLKQVGDVAGAHDLEINLSISGGSQIIAVSQTPIVQRLFTHILKRHIDPKSGLVMLGGEDVGSFDRFRLRSEVIVLDRPTIIETTIRQYLNLAGEDIASSEKLEMTNLVGLESRIATLPDGLDTLLSSSGWPLSYAEVMKLKLAGALLKKPRLLVLSGLYDMLDPAMLARVREGLGAAGTTFIQFTYRPAETPGCRYLWLGEERQLIFDRFDEFADICESGRSGENFARA